MKIHVFVLAALVFAATILAAAPVFAEEREVIFFDDFSSYTDEASLAKKWSAFSGHWFVKDGCLNQDTGSFDTGIVVRDLYLRCDYSFECKVRLVSGGAGAGLYWNVYDQVTGESGNMLRYDGNVPIMYGWMGGRGFLGTGGASGNLRADGTWHTMRLDVFNSTGKFDLYWDGVKIADQADEYHRSGYVGLQCSLGYSQFDDVKITVAKGTDWKAVPKGKVMPEWVESVAVLPNGNYVYPVRNLHRIQIVTPEGKLVREFGELGDGAGQLRLPSAVAVDKTGRIFVVEAGNKRVQIFDQNGKSLKMFAPNGRSAFDNPFGIAVAADGKIWVSDRGRGRIYCFDEAGEILMTLGGAKPGTNPGEFNSPKHVTIIGNKLYVADTGNNRIQIFDLSNGSAAPQVIRMPWGPVAVIAWQKGGFAVSNGSGIGIFDSKWNQVKTFSGAAANQMVFDKSGNLVVADAWNKKLAILSTNLSDVTPVVTKITTDSAVVTWKTDLPSETKLMLFDTPQPTIYPSVIDYSKAKVFTGKPGTEHTVIITGLKPATRHIFTVTSPYKTIPPTERGADYRFFTKEPAGMMAYTEVPIAILCYANITYESQKDASGKVPPPTVRGDDWLQQNINVHEAMRLWYWRNSHMRLDTKCYYLKVDRPVDVSSLGSSSEEVAKDLEALAAREGMKPTDFGAVLVMGAACCYAYPWPTPWWGGKLTYTTGCCFPGGGDLWLSTHEFHHLTEGWFSMAGIRGYTCADNPWLHPGRFGENFDFLAHVNRSMKPEDYLNLAVGKIRLTEDKDGDGVPDNCPNAPWDEARAGTDPTTKTSWDNGLDDLQNLTAEIFYAADKNNRHPMRTQQIDLKYPFAVFNYEYERHKATPTIDGVIKEGEWQKFASTPNAITPPPADSPFTKLLAREGQNFDYRMQTFLNWDDSYVYIAAKAPFKFVISPQLDGDGDGYFHGKANIITYYSIPRDETTAKPNTLLPPPGVMIWNCDDVVKATGGPNWTNDYFDQKDKLKWAWGKDDDGWYNLEIAIPRCDKVGFVPKAGKEMGIRFWIKGLLPPTEKDPDPGYTWEMFDSCEYGYFKLVK